MSRGLVQYPMRVGESERSGWRDYDDGSAGNAAKYDDAHWGVNFCSLKQSHTIYQ